MSKKTIKHNSVLFILTKDSLSSSSAGTEELAHMEMIAAILYQLTRNLSMEEIKKAGFDTYFVDHTTGIYPVSAAGVPFTTAYIGVKGDLFADLHEDLAADAAIAQKQHVFSRAKKSLFYKGFSVFTYFYINAPLQSHKNNMPLFPHFSLYKPIFRLDALPRISTKKSPILKNSTLYIHKISISSVFFNLSFIK